MKDKKLKDNLGSVTSVEEHNLQPTRAQLREILAPNAINSTTLLECAKVQKVLTL